MWWTPDRLTAVGFFGAMLVAIGYILSNFSPLWLWLSVGGYCFNWFGDSLDGSIARYRKIERPNYGYFIDHSLDALSNMLLIIGMGLSPYLRMDTALLGLSGYLLLSPYLYFSKAVWRDESHLFRWRPNRGADHADCADHLHVYFWPSGDGRLARGRRDAVTL
jgi:archaetidylinositol phosphate synthase